MRGLSKHYRCCRGCLTIFLILLLCAILSACNGTQPVIHSFFATPSTIAAGESATLSWTVTDADSVTIDNGIGPVDSNGITTVHPITDTTYTLMATNSAGTISSTVTVTVAPIDTIILQPGFEGKDASVCELFPNANYGLNNYLTVGYYSSSGNNRAFLQFDMNSAALPAGAVVMDAYLSLYQRGFEGSGDFLIGLYQVTTNWQEDSVTWNNQPTSKTDAAYTLYVDSNIDTWRSWSIGDLVKGWLDGSISNNGLVLKPVEEPINDKYAVFEFSENTIDITKRPQLVIDYYVP